MFEIIEFFFQVFFSNFQPKKNWVYTRYLDKTYIYKSYNFNKTKKNICRKVFFLRKFKTRTISMKILYENMINLTILKKKSYKGFHICNFFYGKNLLIMIIN